MGQLFMVNPPGRKKRRKKPRTAAQRRATKKMLAARKRAVAGKKSSTRKRSSTMARKARKSRTKSRKRRTSAKRRSPGVRLVRRGVAVYQGNPKRRKRSGRRRSYRHNPSIVGMLKQGVTDSLLTLGGGAAQRVASNFVPLANDGIMGAAKGLLVALGIGYGAKRFLSAEQARFVTAGAMQPVLKGLITGFVPAAGAYLGDYDSIGSYGVEGYIPGSTGAGSDFDPSELGAYAVE